MQILCITIQKQIYKRGGLFALSGISLWEGNISVEPVLDRWSHSLTLRRPGKVTISDYSGAEALSSHKVFALFCFHLLTTFVWAGGLVTLSCPFLFQPCGLCCIHNFVPSGHIAFFWAVGSLDSGETHLVQLSPSTGFGRRTRSQRCLT